MTAHAPAATVARGRIVPGDGLLHPVAAAAVGLLLVNDHVLKPAYPGWATGKLSDIAGLLFFPLLLVAAAEVVAAVAARPWGGPGRTAPRLALIATGAVFAAVKLLPEAEAAYEHAVGTLQWPFRAAVDLATGVPARPAAPVDVVRDPTDLVALAALWVAYRLAIGRSTDDRDPIEVGVAGVNPLPPSPPPPRARHPAAHAVPASRAARRHRRTAR